MKHCKRCDTLKSLEEFNKDKSKAFGVSSNCKSCIKSKSAKYLEKNRAIIVIKKKIHYDKNKHKPGRVDPYKAFSMIAHQYKVRQQKMIEEQSNPYWLDLDLSLTNATVKPVTRKLATSIIKEYEWLKCMPAFSRFYFGIYFKSIDGKREECGGVVVFSDEYSANTKNWDKYEFNGKMILLSRGVCKHWCPINTNSKLIMAAIKLLPTKYDIVTCTTDPDAGEIGTIYQACNFHYVGVMRKKANRFAVKIDGKIYGSRTIRSRIGTMKKEKILEHFPNAEIFMQKSKSRYFYFIRNKKKYLNNIKHLLKPYPKRKRAESFDSAPLLTD